MFIAEGPATAIAPGITKQSTSAYDIHAWHESSQSGGDDSSSVKETANKTIKNGHHSGSLKVDSHNKGTTKEKTTNNRHFDLPFRHPKVRSLSNKMTSSGFGSLPSSRRRANTTGSRPPPPARSRSETFIHVPQATFDDDVQYSDEGSLYELNEIVGESDTSRFPWQRDVGIQCQKRYRNAEVQVDMVSTCPQCGSTQRRSDGYIATVFESSGINSSTNAEMLGYNSTSALHRHHHHHNNSNVKPHHHGSVPSINPPELMFNGLPDAEVTDDAEIDITGKSRTRERPLSDPGIDQFDNIPWINTNVNAEAEEFINMKVKKEKLRLNLPTELEYVDSKSFPLSPCPSPHKQVSRRFYGFGMVGCDARMPS